MSISCFKDDPPLCPINRLLQGICKVPFQNNFLSVAIILIANFCASWMFVLTAIVGATTSISTALVRVENACAVSSEKTLKDLREQTQRVT